jgi:5-methylcytosine-specific restriction endonuclease McrA
VAGAIGPSVVDSHAPLTLAEEVPVIVAGALLLNASFEPLCVVSPRRAVVLLLKDKAEVVHRNGAVFHSERQAVAVPSVLRLCRYVKVPYRSYVPLSRRAVFSRDGHRCQYCDRAAENLDHVVPRSRGGSHSWENVVACCRRCNARKEDRLLEETDLVLRRRPRAPHSSVWLVANAGAVDPVWHQYLGADERDAVPA